MLSDLYDSVDIKGKIDHNFIRSAISANMEWSIPWKCGFTSDIPDTPDIVKEVMDIFDMWRAIEDSYKELSDDDKTILEKNANPFGNKPKFEGFDGNNESEYMRTALFLVNKLDKFSEFKGRDLNSHSRSIDIHRKMLPTFTEILDKSGFPFQVDDLAKILLSPTYPSNLDKQRAITRIS